MYQLVAQGIENVRKQTVRLFKETFQREATAVVLAPGRVNLIGEHIDYNQGIVLPFAIDLQTAVAIAPSEEPRIRLISTSDRTRREYSSFEQAEQPWADWTRYIQGVWHYWKMSSGMAPGGFDLAVSSSLPVGAGLSSSAALCVASLLALQKVESSASMRRASTLDLLEQATLCQRVEHHFAGVRCGLMDQLASLACRADNLLAIDFRGPTLTQIPWPNSELACLLVHTGVQHELASSEYGKRRAECESAAIKLGLGSLRECSLEMLEKARGMALKSLSDMSETGSSTSPILTNLEYLRARHVVSEIGRTDAAIKACQAGDSNTLGELMNASHQSLRDDYAVSCQELDYLVDKIRGLPGVLGSRMTGGGFGGSMIALVEPKSDWKSPLEGVLKEYQLRFQLAPRWLLCRPSAGALELVSGRDPRESGEG